MYKWFISTQSISLPNSGLIIQTEAMQCIEKINVNNFKASKGWLQRLRRDMTLFGNKSVMKYKRAWTNYKSFQLLFQMLIYWN